MDQEKIDWSEQTRGLRKRLGERIVEMRVHRGLSRETLADLLGVPYSRLAKWRSVTMRRRRKASWR